VNLEDYDKLAADINNIRILNAVAKKFPLDKDDLEHLKGVALWKASLTYKGGKFTTHLYRSMKWECMKAIRKRVDIPLEDDLVKSLVNKKQRSGLTDIDRIELEDLLSVLSKREKEVIEGRLQNRTFEDIGEDFGVTKERIRQIYKAALEKMRKEI